MSKDKQEIIILTGDGWGLKVTDSANALKAELMKTAAAITSVTDSLTSTTARAKISELAAIRIAVEKKRKEVKAPIIELGGRIDAAAKDYIGQLTDEENRLSKLVGDHAAKIEAERQAAERARLAAERERMRLELLEEQRQKAAEMERTRIAEAAEKARKDAEEALFAGDDDDIEEAAEAELAAAQEQARLEAIEAEAKAKAIEAKAQADHLAQTLMAPPPKAEGVKFDLDFEVTDIHALYAHASSLVTLTERRADILALLKRQKEQGMQPGLPGVIVTQKARITK